MNVERRINYTAAVKDLLYSSRVPRDPPRHLYRRMDSGKLDREWRDEGFGKERVSYREVRDEEYMEERAADSAMRE